MALPSKILNITFVLAWFVLVHWCAVSVMRFGIIDSMAIAMILKGLMCEKIECCEEHTKIVDSNTLKWSLLDKIHGQNMAIGVILSTIGNKYVNVSAGLPMSIELYGPPGTGKSYASALIAEGIFYRGLKSPLVHEFDGDDLQLTEEHGTNYKDLLKTWLIGNLTQCNKNMFIFKHTDKIPEELLEIVKDVLKLEMGGMFIFTTTERGPIVSELYSHQLRLAIMKKYMNSRSFQPVLQKSLFNLKQRALFLPMEERDLKYCMLDEFERMKHFVPSQCMMNKVYKRITFDQFGYTETSCKDVVNLTRYVIEHEMC